MKKTVKNIVCILFILCFALFSTSCTSIFTPIESSKGEQNTSSSVEKLPEGTKLNFEINVTNSLDIVPDGVSVLEHIRPSVVEIYCTSPSGKSSGSGVILSLADSDENGENDQATVVTCHHVIDGANSIVVKAIDGTEYGASLVGSDPDSDICVLFIQKTEDVTFDNISAATWYQSSTNLKVGTEVYAIGNPLGTLGGTVTSGIVSAINRDVVVENTKMTLIQTDAAINGGNSGGGLFDKNTGALIGIVNAGYASSTAQGLSFAIPSSTAVGIVEQLLGNGYIEGRYDFGVEFSLYSVRTSYWSSDYYVGIKYLDEYGVFAKNGFEVEDVILSIKIGDKETFEVPKITNSNVNTIVSDLTEYVYDSSYEIGDGVTVTYRRFNTNGSYDDNTVNFKISQYVYGG